MNYKSFLTTRQTTKIKRSFANNISTDIKFSKVQIFKIIQQSGSFASWLSILGKKALTNIAIPLARDNWPWLLSNLTLNAINRFERKSGRGATRAGKGLTLFISNKDMNEIIKITKSLVDPNVLIDGITETVKHKIKNKNADFLELF